MSALPFYIVIFSMIASVQMFHLQSNPDQVANVCTSMIQMVCNYHSPPLICRGHQYQDASPVTPMCDMLGQRTCGIPPIDVYNGARLQNPFYCFNQW